MPLRAEGQSLQCVLQAGMALDGSGYLSQFVQLNVVRLDSSLNFMEFSGFPKSSRTDLVREPFLDFPTSS